MLQYSGTYCLPAELGQVASSPGQAIGASNIPMTLATMGLNADSVTLGLPGDLASRLEDARTSKVGGVPVLAAEQQADVLQRVECPQCRCCMVLLLQVRPQALSRHASTWLTAPWCVTTVTVSAGPREHFF